MFVSKIVIEGKTYKVNDRLKFIDSSDTRGYGSLSALKRGEVVKIAVIKRSKSETSDRATLFGLCTIDYTTRRGWHDLDHSLSGNFGYYVELTHIKNNFIYVTKDMVINRNFPFRKKNLKAMKCKIVSPMPGNSESLVEFKENIGGCGADGLGKGGHCLVVPNSILSPIDKKAKAKTNKKTKRKKKSR